MKSLCGRIIDVDSHEMMPAAEWPRYFGSEVKDLAEFWERFSVAEMNRLMPGKAEQLLTGGYHGDVAAVGPDIGNVKGPNAPGATDPGRRLEVMDAMGIRSQLMFPSGIALLGFTAQLGKGHPELARFGSDVRRLGKRWMEVYSEWAITAARISGRIRPVLPVYGETPEALFDNARRLIDSGIRALWLASGALLGGRSPAHPDLDRFWALLSETRTAALLHGGGEGQFLETRAWKDAPAFDGYRSTAEFDFDPWSMSVYHLPSQNFVTTLIFGGVFARFPELRLGVIEVGSHWVGPLLEMLDLVYGAFRSPTAYRLPRQPSDYMRENVRVSVLIYEPVDLWLSRHAGLEDILCFSTDYPHPEGGRGALERLYDRIAPLGTEVVEKFFVTNGEALVQG
jgi:hypothetical protein